MKDSVMRPHSPRRALPGAIAGGAFDLSVAFEGLANPTRLAAVGILATVAEIGVGELAERCRVSQPRMSWHLRILKSAQVVSTRRDGREVLVRLDRESIARNLRGFVDLISANAEPGVAAVVHQSIEGIQPNREASTA
jgi:DNA-binding transcriptional ArsR family regulator